jgi:filamentous hemagglutinin family protein
MAQIIPDNSLGSENSVVVPNVEINGIDSDRIDGGAIRGSNLFHSFQEFNIDNGRGAYFSNPANISNILSRVTGNNLSNILGTLGVLGNANLFLINPNGIVFGPNARLDVGGSFFASTADSILFENGVEFAASNPDAPPLLTINIPIGLNFRENPGSIVNQARSTELNSDGTTTFSGLAVPSQETIALIGGEVRFESGVISSPGSRLELGGLSESGRVELNPDGSFSFPTNTQRADVLLTEASLAEVVGNPGGSVAINTRNLEIVDGSQVASGISNISNPFDSGVEENVETEVLQAGDVIINATESVILTGRGSGIGNIVFPSVTGNAGSIDIQTNLLSVSDDAQINAATFGNGDGGNLTITATDIELIGTFANSQAASALGTSVAPGATGNGGTLTINTQNLRVRDGAQILASTFGNGDGGNLTITATDIELIGTGSRLGPSVESGARGNGGTLTINTQNLRVQEGAQISASTFGNGNGGNLTITATDIELIGRSADGQFPSSLGASVAPGAIGNGGSLTINTQNLRVREGAQISASTFGNGDGGNLTVTATDIELIGHSADGQFPSSLQALVAPGARGNGGTLTINTQNLRVQEGAQIFTSTFGNGDGGNLNVTATDIKLIGSSADGQFPSGLGASVEQGAIGNGGILTIDTQRLVVQEGAQISANTFGNGSGGSLTVKATDVELVGTAANGQFASGLGVSVEPGAIGNGGTLSINAERLLLSDGAQILAVTSGSGKGGNILIQAEDVELNNLSLIGALVDIEGTGNGGTITIDTQNLTLQERTSILASTLGNGNGGDISIQASAIELIGVFENSQFLTRIDASVGIGATGDGGTVIIDAQNLVLRDGAQISSGTFGNGNGGNLIVNADQIELLGTTADSRLGSGLNTSVATEATGNGGTIRVNAQNLVLRDGSQIGAGTSGNGNGGNLIVNADQIELLGDSLDRQSSSGLFTSTVSESSGIGGKIEVNADNLTIRDRATIDVRSESTEAAGDLIINAPNILLDNQASLNGETTAGEGDIILNTDDLRLRNNSSITTNATGVATGGNITINTETLTALEDSDISANAEDAFGGRIVINAAGIFGSTFREQQTRFSDITATSELGPEFSGTVELNTELDPSSGLIDLSQTVVNPNDLIAQEFCRQRGGSEFVITGRGGIAADPYDKATGNQIEVDLVEPVPSQPRNSSQRRSETEDNQPISSLDLVPARGWIRDENGDVILVGYDPTKTGVRRQPAQHPQCQP